MRTIPASGWRSNDSKRLRAAASSGGASITDARALSLCAPPIAGARPISSKPMLARLFPFLPPYACPDTLIVDL